MTLRQSEPLTLLVAVPVPSPNKWKLVQHLDDVPDGYAVIARLAAGRRPAVLEHVQCEARPTSTTELPSELEELLGYFARMNNQQRAMLLEAARELLHERPAIAAAGAA
jgi:hypothetical protein